MINYNVDPVEVGLRSHFTQGHGSVIESGNYYRPTDAVGHQFGWVKPSGNQPPVVVPRHLGSVPDKDRLVNMMPVLPGEPIDQTILHYSAGEPVGNEGILMRILRLIGGIVGKILSLFGLGSAAASGPGVDNYTPATEPTGTATQTGPGAQAQPQTAGVPHYTSNITNYAAALPGNMTIFSRTITM